MSNIYIQEPPTHGKVLICTTAGEFDIELWSKEAPKATRNFIQLCMEGYYDGTIFHRVVPGFIVQGGDPTGTGEGGESIYGKPFRDEFHTRLRFVRRGLVAMANAGPHDNGSQFFFTLGPCQELQNKHTIFGKLAGKTQYNLSRFEEGEIEENDRPAYPYKITKTEVLSNPFPDIEPRVKIENEVPKEERKKKQKGTKDLKLLSFGDEAEEDEEEIISFTKKVKSKGNSAHDIAQDPTLSAMTEDISSASALEGIRKKLKTAKDTKEAENNKLEMEANVSTQESIDEKTTDKLAKLKAENKRLMREIKGKDPKATDDKLPNNKETKDQENVAIEAYKEDIKVYKERATKILPKGDERENQTMARLERFRDKLRGFLDASDDENEDKTDHEDNDDENSDLWLRKKIVFRDDAAPVLAKDASTKNDTWYDMNDPRNAINKRRREMGSKSKKMKT